MRSGHRVHHHQHRAFHIGSVRIALLQTIFLQNKIIMVNLYYGLKTQIRRSKDELEQKMFASLKWLELKNDGKV